MNVSSIALGGYQQAERQLESVAGKIARRPLVAAASTPEDSVDLATSMVALMQAQRAAEANLVVLKSADAMSRHTLEVFG